MASNTKNKYPADKGGSKYSEFKNTKRVAPGKTRADKDAKQAADNADQSGKTA